MILAGAVGLLTGFAAGWWLCQGRRHPWIWSILPAAVLGVIGFLAWREADVFAVLLSAFSVGGIVGAWIDAETHRLPDWLTWPLAGVLVGVVVVHAAWVGEWADATRAIGAGVVVMLALFCLAWVSQLGLGDVKLGLSIGLLLGYKSWWLVAVGLGMSLLAAGAWAAVLLARGHDRKSFMPLGPSLFIGTVTAALAW